MTTFITVRPERAEAICRKCDWTISGPAKKVNFIASLHRHVHKAKERGESK